LADQNGRLCQRLPKAFHRAVVKGVEEIDGQKKIRARSRRIVKA